MADAPEIIHATINGASTSLPSGQRQLIGGWGEADGKPNAVRYVRADLYAALEAENSGLREVLGEALAWAQVERRWADGPRELSRWIERDERITAALR